MKNLLIVFTLLLLAQPFKGAAQISVHINIGNPPWWAPRAYAHHTRYYYIPEIDSYYDASREGYFVNIDGGWVFSPNLPEYYGPENFDGWHKVVINYYGDQPYRYFNTNRYGYVQSYHPEWERNNWNRPHDNGKHKGWYKHHGEGDWGDHGDGGDHGDHEKHGGHGHGHDD